MRRRLKQWWWGIVGALWLLSPVPAGAQDDVGWLLGQINTLRGQVGLHSYVLNAQLSAAAQQHSQYMAATCSVTHVESNGSLARDRAAANGYAGGWISENIYGGRNARASDAWNFWINSPIHYSGLTHQIVNEIGIGIARSDCGQYFTLVFGQRDEVNPPPAPAPAAPVSEANSSTAAEAAPAAALPTPIPYVPPTRTPTPTPTVPTLTPSATWTITPTHTASPTPSVQPPTATALILPTVPALEITAMPTDRPSPSPPIAVAVGATDVPLNVVSADTPTAAPELEPVPVAAPEPGRDWRDLVTVALAAQVVLLGLATVVYWRRSG